MDPRTALATLLCLALPVLTFGYLITCAIWPFGPCRRCKGTGRIRAPFSRAFRHCPRCRATGIRIRIGRHVWNEIRRIEREGTKR